MTWIGRIAGQARDSTGRLQDRIGERRGSPISRRIGHGSAPRRKNCASYSAGVQQDVSVNGPAAAHARGGALRRNPLRHWLRKTSRPAIWRNPSSTSAALRSLPIVWHDQRVVARFEPAGANGAAGMRRDSIRQSLRFAVSISKFVAGRAASATRCNRTACPQSTSMIRSLPTRTEAYVAAITRAVENVACPAAHPLPAQALPHHSAAGIIPMKACAPLIRHGDSHPIGCRSPSPPHRLATDPADMDGTTRTHSGSGERDENCGDFTWVIGSPMIHRGRFAIIRPERLVPVASPTVGAV